MSHHNPHCHIDPTEFDMSIYRDLDTPKPKTRIEQMQEAANKLRNQLNVNLDVETISRLKELATMNRRSIGQEVAWLVDMEYNKINAVIASVQVSAEAQNA